MFEATFFLMEPDHDMAARGTAVKTESLIEVGRHTQKQEKETV